jgi:hypothetical protein
MGVLTVESLSRIPERFWNESLDFIETGTHTGDTLMAMVRSGRFKFLHSIELDHRLYYENRQRFHNMNNVTLHQGRSEDILNYLPAIVQNRPVIWLDAHSDTEVPLLSELESCRHFGKKPIILIDDMFYMIPSDDMYERPPYPEVWPSIEQIKEKIDTIGQYVYNCFFVQGKEDTLLAYPLD